MDNGKRFRAPVQDGAILAVPGLHTVGDMLTINRQRLQSAGDHVMILDLPLSDLRRKAREHAIGAGSVSDRIFVAGHQPELFHPGVWVKNFALYGLARKHHAASLNLVVDDDTIKTTALHVPVPPHVRRVLFDRWTGAAPYEERTIVDRALFAGFAERVGELTQDWPFEPMLPAFWAEVLHQAKRTTNLGECFAAARRTFEQAWGCHNREAPLSSLCDSEPFAYFACHLLANLPYFHSLYNTIIADYRRRHAIRDRQHPVPDLASDGDWLEAPFWIWRTGASRRERLFARFARDRVEIKSVGWVERSETHQAPLVGLATLDPPYKAGAIWEELRANGFKIRTRALTTTLYARLFLADLFLHGIGGGIYDELTDELIRSFYGCEPPEYLVLSATRLLPLPRPAATVADRRCLQRELRDVHYNPQRHLDNLSISVHLSERSRLKQEAIARQPATSAQRRERFHTLRTLTEELRNPLASREEQLRQQLQDCEQQLRINAVLQRRDYSFCLFPESVLRPFCTQFLHNEPEA